MMSRLLQAVRILIVVAIAASCKHWEPLVERDFEISPQPIVLHFSRPYQATGPTRELCLTTVGDEDVRRIAPDGNAPRDSPILAVLIRQSGERDTIGYHNEEPSMISSGRNNGPVVSIYDERRVCLWDHGLGNPADDHLVRWDRDTAGQVVGSAPAEHPLPPLKRTYVGVELRCRVPLRIREAAFWTGQRKAFL